MNLNLKLQKKALFLLLLMIGESFVFSNYYSPFNNSNIMSGNNSISVNSSNSLTKSNIQPNTQSNQSAGKNNQSAGKNNQSYADLFNSMKLKADPKDIGASNEVEAMLKNGTKTFNIICAFEKDPTASFYSNLTSMGIFPTDKWDSALYGFSADITANQLVNLQNYIKNNGLLNQSYIEVNHNSSAQMYITPSQMNVRPYVWDTLGYAGDPNSSIAILDTGIDTSNPNDGPYGPTIGVDKVIGWHDSTDLNSSTPIDDNSHGSHVAGIAAGNGFTPTDPQGRFVFSVPVELNMTGQTYSTGVSYGESVAYFNVTQPGEILIQSEFSDQTQTTNERVYGQIGLWNSDDTELFNITTFTTASSWSNENITYDVTSSNLGLYNIVANFTFQSSSGSSITSPDFYYAVTAHTPFTLPTDGHPLLSGVAYNSSLVGVKVLDKTGVGSDTWIINGINWVVQNKLKYHITIMSMSFGSTSNDPLENTAIENAIDGGIVAVAAAGNDGPGGNYIGSPGNIDDVITVAAVNDKDQITSYSSQGGLSNTGNTIKPDIAAPGGTFTDPIYSTDSNDNDGFFSDQYPNDSQPMQGTSMATPAVSGAAALLIDALGGQNAWSYTRSSVMNIKNLLLMTASETNQPRENDTTGQYSPQLNRGGKDDQEGYGIINVDAAISAVTKTVSLKSIYQGSLYASKFDVSKPHVWARAINLIAGYLYNFTLIVPSTADFDIYLYDKTPSTYGDPIIVEKSTTPGSVNENLTFNAPYSGVYYVVIKAVSGYGSFILNTGDYAVPQCYNTNIYPSEGFSTLRTITINLTEKYPLKVWAKIEYYRGYSKEDSFGDVINTVQLFDDANHSDVNANDGIYGNTVNVSYYPNGKYYVDFLVQDNVLGVNVSFPEFQSGFYIGPDKDKPSAYIIPDNDSINQGGIINFTGRITDFSGINSAKISIYRFNGTNGTFIQNVSLYDDGKHGDLSPDDTIYGCIWNSTGVPIGSYYYSITAIDNSSAKNTLFLPKFGYFNITNGSVKNNCLPTYSIDYPHQNEKIWGDYFSIVTGYGMSLLNSFSFRIYSVSRSSYINNWQTDASQTYNLYPGDYILVTNGTDSYGNIGHYNISFTMLGVLSTTLTNLTTNTGLHLVLNWTEDNDATSYRIYRESSFIYPNMTPSLTPYLTIDSTSNTSFIDSNMTAGTYYYVIIAANSYAQSWISNELNITYNPPIPTIPGELSLVDRQTIAIIMPIIEVLILLIAIPVILKKKYS